MKFNYQSIMPDGQAQSGELEAEDRRQALAELRAQGATVVSLKEHAATAGRSGLFGKRQASRQDLLLVLSELATLLGSGVSLKDSLDSLAGGQRSPEIKAVIQRWVSGVRRGDSLSDTLRHEDRVLPEYLFQLVRAGELTGELGQSLQTAVDQMEYERQIANEMKNALVYPAILCVSGVAAVLLVFTFVVPQFQNLLEHGDRLPTLAWLVLTVGKWVDTNLVLVGVVAATALLAAVRLFSLPQVRTRMMDAIQRLPVVGDWIKESETARWASVLAALVAHRVPILEALELARKGVKLPSRQLRLKRVTDQVKTGVPLSQALKENDVITSTGFNLLRAGEKSGEVARLLKALARFHDGTGRDRMKRFLTLIEPVAILLIGGVIGVIITGVILAITSANDIAL